MADPTVRNLTLDLLKPTHLLQKAKDELLSQMREERARQMEKRDAESKLQAISADIARQEDIIWEARAHPSVRKRMHDSSQLRPGDKVVLKDDEEGRALTVLEVLPPEPLPPGPLRFQATSGMASTQVVAVEIQRSAAFKITGFNGSTMTSLKAFTKALCWTENAPHNGMAKVIIRGSHKQVELCKKVVNGLVDGSIRPQDLAQLAQIRPFLSTHPAADIWLPLLPEEAVAALRRLVEDKPHVVEPPFIAATRYEGAKRGYTFTRRAQGLGYYCDLRQAPRKQLDQAALSVLFDDQARPFDEQPPMPRRDEPGSACAQRVRVKSSAGRSWVVLASELLKKRDDRCWMKMRVRVSGEPGLACLDEMDENGTVGFELRQGACYSLASDLSEGHIQYMPHWALISEADFLEKALQESQRKKQTAAQGLKQADDAWKAAAAKVREAEQLVKERKAAKAKAKRALTVASKEAKEMTLVTWVRFRNGQRPKAWRDISKFVTFEWGAAQQRDEEGAPPRVFSLADCKTILQQAIRNHNVESVITTGTLGAPPVRLSYKEAKLMLHDASKTSPQEENSFALLKAALGALERVVLDEPLQSFFDAPETGIIRAKEVPVPGVLCHVLRNYQATGFHWLVNNARNGLGCVLADDMGLGKTIQAISLLLYLKQNALLERPALVVVPKGLLGTWTKELRRWAGDSLRLHLYYGNQRKMLQNARSSEDLDAQGSQGSQTSQGSRLPEVRNKKRKATEPVEADIMLTSYHTLRNDIGALAQEQLFAAMILDEAQQIKNPKCQVAQAVRSMAAQCGNIRVALSGTPVENRLSDLYSQFEFVLPGYLANSRAEFERDFGRPLGQAAKKKQDSVEVLETRRLLQRLTQPFVMRRLKTDKNVAGDLPPKVEQEHECELHPLQAKIYQSLQESCLADAAGAQGAIARHGKVLAMLHALRQTCNHPAVLKEESRPQGPEFRSFPPRSATNFSGKCEKLHELLESILSANDKVLVFSSHINTIHMLEQQISEKWNTKVGKILGSMTNEQREEAMEIFQTDPGNNVMLISLQAGGVGVTLTAASHVIHFDRCYNPAKENQATDRAHRIGQTKTVFVHRLTCKDTFEERLAQIMEMKQRLSDWTVQSGEGWIADLGNAELRELFALGGQGTAPRVKRSREVLED
ncbi:unnamed protein product [Effrenium voratum]|nr:unnamed protein product [Effrenium voratum]